MRLIFLTIFFAQQFLLNGQLTCPPTGVICVSQTQYQFCTIVNGQVVTTSDVASCPSGQICNSAATFTCQIGSTQVQTTTAAGTTVTETPCNQTAVYPGPQCNQYYSCTLVMWWYSYDLLTCPSGQAFNQTSGQCADSTTCTASG